MKPHKLITIGLVLLLGICFTLPADARVVRSYTECDSLLKERIAEKIGRTSEEIDIVFISGDNVNLQKLLIKDKTNGTIIYQHHFTVIKNASGEIGLTLTYHRTHDEYMRRDIATIVTCYLFLAAKADRLYIYHSGDNNEGFFYSLETRGIVSDIGGVSIDFMSGNINLSVAEEMLRTSQGGE